MKLEIRKIVSFVDDTLIEGGRAAPRPLRMAASAVVIRNPWAGGFVEDLVPTIHAYAQGLADALIGLLELDFVFVRLCDPTGAGAVDVTRGSAWKTFPEWLDGHLDMGGRLDVATAPGAGTTYAARRTS